MFQKLLIANRGEIACRITRTAQRLGIPVVAIYSDVDRNAMHVELADVAVEIGGARPADSYLNAGKIMNAAKQTGADAIHPGYGFLSENSVLAENCEKESIEFIGPSSEAIRIMASKSTAAGIAEQANVRILPGYRSSSQHLDSMISAAKEIGYPVLLKSALGGGGRGMRIVYNESEFSESLLSARSESKEAFDDDAVIIEKYLGKARHVEVQIAADKHGNIVHLFDRDCSAQRRYQKIIEEAPAPNIADELRFQMYEAAVSLANALDYHSVGTVEFLFDGESFYFMEMNTRLQVEHPVTEQITGTDLVEWQLRIAAGESIKAFPLPAQPIGHSVEARIYAENPSKEFLPSPGTIEYLTLPATSDRLLVHTGVRERDNVDQHYDPLIAKIVSYESDRSSAIKGMLNGLSQLHVAGVNTNVNFLSNLLQHDSFLNDNIDVRFVETRLDELTQVCEHLPNEIAAIAALFLHSTLSADHNKLEKQEHADQHSPWKSSTGWRLNSIQEITELFEYNNEFVNVTTQLQQKHGVVLCGSQRMNCSIEEIQDKTITVEIDGSQWQATVVNLPNLLFVFHNFSLYELRVLDKISVAHAPMERSGTLTAPLPGRVVRTLVKTNDVVTTGQKLMVIEAMKMEHQITSPLDGIVTSVNYGENEQIDEGAVCVVVEPLEPLDSKSEGTVN